MFEALETGKHLPQDEFKRLRDELRPALLNAQFALKDQDYPVIIVIGGLEGAGKGAVIHRLNAWMDPRLIETHAFWQHSDEEESRPYFWRFWRSMPPKGHMGIMHGSWYTQPYYQAVDGALDDGSFATAMGEIELFERMLTDDGALIIKVWLHVSSEMQQLQLAEQAPDKQQNPRVPADALEWRECYSRALEVAEDMLRLTHSGAAPWHRVEADDSNYRDISVANIVLEALRGHEPPELEHSDSKPAGLGIDLGQPTVLDAVDLTQSLSHDTYKTQLAQLQDELQELAWQARRQSRSLITVFEGWDAAGKGSAIRRITEAIDPRLYKLVQFAAPTDEERAQHYLWRFWRQLQRDGRATMFDRSWYGRVLVERVENLTPVPTWRRAYNEINQFEHQLATHGCIIAKFWIHVSKEEQLNRFEDREKQAHKQHKITDDDWRNREKWDDYEQAVGDMIANTSTGYAPWHLIAGDDKKFARVQILRTVCEAMRASLAKK